MKYFLFFILCLFLSTSSFSQWNSDFEDGTLQGWTNTDGAIIDLTVEEIGNQYEEHMLQKVCDGSNSPVGEMAIINNSDEWTGSYPNGDFDAFSGLEVYMKNDNDFDLHIRIGYMGGNDNTKIITTESFLIPAFSDWTFDGFNVAPSDFTVIEGENTVQEIFEDSHEVRIIHNDAISYDGKVVEGSLNISLILSSFLLSNEDEDLSKLKLYPNPVNSIINLKLPYESSGSVKFYNVLGENVLSKIVSSTTTQIDVSELKSGIYLVRIQTENQSTIKKIIKL